MNAAPEPARTVAPSARFTYVTLKGRREVFLCAAPPEAPAALRTTDVCRQAGESVPSKEWDMIHQENVFASMSPAQNTTK